METLEEELNKRQIQREEGSDRIRWGTNAARCFNIKEAYNLLQNHDPSPQDAMWKGLWNRNHWLKISLFLWLVMHKKILTWDHLKKKGSLALLFAGYITPTLRQPITSSMTTLLPPLIATPPPSSLP